LYVLALSGNNDLESANDNLKTALLESLDTKKMLTHYLCVKDGVILPVDITLDVVADKYFKKFSLELQTRIQRQVNDFFLLSKWDFGQSLRDSDLIKSISGIKEITRADAHFETTDQSGSLISARYFEVLRPDNIFINFNFE